MLIAATGITGLAFADNPYETKEWKPLQDFHVALYAQADAQYRRPAVDEPGKVFGQSTPIVQKPGSLPVTQGASAGQASLVGGHPITPVTAAVVKAHRGRGQLPGDLVQAR